MKITTRYIWKDKEGWRPWTGCQLAIEQGQNGHYSIYEGDGTLLAECVDYTSAQRVVARIRQLELAPVTPFSLPQVGFLRPIKEGWEFFRMDALEDNGKRFVTREEAEAYIRAQSLQ